VRTCLAYGLAGGERLLPRTRLLHGAKLPDLGTVERARVVIKSVRWRDGPPLLASSLPASRSLFILRHPCGQVASVMRGARQRRFELREAGTDMPFDETQAIAHAAAAGVTGAAFQALPDAAKYAWSWVAFNAPVPGALAEHPNIRVVIYEDLCARPVAMAREVMAFAGLDWTAQSEGFLARSTRHDGPAGYYAVFRNSLAAAEGWRTTMTEPDQAAVRSVVQQSNLARYWPDLTGRGSAGEPGRVIIA
jgi:hypothetical protein